MFGTPIDPPDRPRAGRARLRSIAGPGLATERTRGWSFVRGRRFPVACGAAAVVMLSSCVQLVPDLDWEVESPIGSIGIGVDDNAPGVVSSSATDWGDEALEAAIARATGDPRPLDDPASDHATIEVAAEDAGTPTVVTPAESGSEAETPPAGDESPEAHLAETDGEPDGGASGASSDGAEHAEAEEAVRAQARAEGAADASQDLAEGEATEDDDSNVAEAVLPAADPAASSSGPVEASSPEADDVGSRPEESRDAELLGDPVESGAGVPALPKSLRFADLGYWFGREIMTPSKTPFARVLDVRLDWEAGRAQELLVELTSVRGAYGIPFWTLLPFERIEDGLPLADVLLLQPPSTDELAPAPLPAYSELVRQAFAGAEAVALEGAVLGTEVLEAEGGPARTVVKLRDAANLLYRLDLGPSAWFEGTDELPSDGAEFQVEAVESRDERGPVWHVAAIVWGEDRIVLRDEAGSPLRPLPVVVVEAPVLLSAWNLVGGVVQLDERTLAALPPAQRPPNGEGASLAGILMERESGALPFVLARPIAFADEGAGTWVVARERLLSTSDGAWTLDLGDASALAIPAVPEDGLPALDDPELTARIRAFWRLPAEDGTE